MNRSSPLFAEIAAALLALGLLAGCGTVPAPMPTPAPEMTEVPAATPAPEADAVPEEPEADAVDPLVERLAAARKDIRTRKLGHYGMVPIYARDVADGVYDIHAGSNSAFFKITEAQLIVKDGEMLGRITIPSMSYLYVYPGTAEEAAKAPETEWLGFEEVDNRTVFTLPIDRLDGGVPCAAYSKARVRWYDRTLVFDASTLPSEALSFPLPDYELIETALRALNPEGLEEYMARQEEERFQGVPEAVAIPRSDGEYSIEVSMAGGSGRAAVSSPTLLIVREGRAYARLIWSSAYYDYMVVGGALFPNLTTDGGNSVFEIPITALDEPMEVIGDTTAMGDALEIEYTLTFYSDSIGSKGSIPQEAAKKVLLSAGIIIAAGGALNYFVKKKREM